MSVGFQKFQSPVTLTPCARGAQTEDIPGNASLLRLVAAKEGIRP